MTQQLNCMGLACPKPVIAAKQALQGLGAGEDLEVSVDNQAAVQNILRMAGNQGWQAQARTLSEKEFVIRISAQAQAEGRSDTISQSEQCEHAAVLDRVLCEANSRREITVVIAADTMGSGDDQLGRILIKGFLYALTEQDVLPRYLLFYNSGARLTCTDSASLEDIRKLSAQGVEVLTCGTCLDFYGLKDELAVGRVSNMYELAEIQLKADLIVRP